MLVRTFRQLEALTFLTNLVLSFIILIQTIIANQLKEAAFYSDFLRHIVRAWACVYIKICTDSFLDVFIL